MNGTKILLVDDDPTVRAIPGLFLRKWGYDVIEASDGQQALDILSREKIGLVISDWVMPNLTGVELCRKIRASESDCYTYLILCTSKGERSDLIEGMEAGADDFLVKPINKEEMRVRVRAGERVLNLEHGLADRNRELNGINMQLQSAYARMEDDLKAAAWMQASLLPSPSRKTLNVTSEWRFRPSGYVAGDIFNIFRLDDRRVGFYLLDVSGHGVPAAMLSVTLSMVLVSDSAHGNPVKRYNPASKAFDILPPAQVVSDLNSRFQSKDDQYFTIIYGVLDTQTGKLEMTQAGHPGPILLPHGQEPALLGEGGVPVGLLPDMEYETIHAQMNAGDRLVLYSDGIIECSNREGTQFGEQRLLEYLSANKAASLPDILAGLEASMHLWRGSEEFDDDVSMLILELDRA
jgi:sigma-B regulation protein RsbU (phosphoserine phosphatase)